MLPDLKPKIKQLLDVSGADAIVIVNSSTPDPNFFYLTRMEKSDFSHSVLVLKRNGMTFIVPKMEYNLAASQARKAGILVKQFGSFKEMEELIRKEASGKRIGLNLSKISVNSFSSLKKILKGRKFIDISGRIADIRKTKTAPEIESISKACGIASKVMKEVPKIIKVGMKEREIAAEIDKRLKIYGADVAFPTIVAVGKNSSNPHYTAGDKKVKKGEFILVDFGCKVGNYCSDTTRTFIVGKPSAKQKEMLELCKRIQIEIIKMIRPGVKFKDLQKKANSMCEKRYGKMMHMIGHSLGIEVHDPMGNTKRLEEGMIIAIEPALYVKELGGVRIEDDILITKTGCKKLTV